MKTDMCPNAVQKLSVVYDSTSKDRRLLRTLFTPCSKSHVTAVPEKLRRKLLNPICWMPLIVRTDCKNMVVDVFDHNFDNTVDADGSYWTRDD